MLDIRTGKVEKINRIRFADDNVQPEVANILLLEQGLSFPWPSLTEKTLGLRKGEMYVIAATMMSLGKLDKPEEK